MSGFGIAGIWGPLLLGILLLAMLGWTIAREFRREERPLVVASATFEEILRERLERGEISDREFEYTMLQVKDS